MPAHSSSWGAGMPEMMVQGCGALFAHGDTMNPTVQVTFDTLDKFLVSDNSVPLLSFPPPSFPSTPKCARGLVVMESERRRERESAREKKRRREGERVREERGGGTN